MRTFIAQSQVYILCLLLVYTVMHIVLHTLQPNMLETQMMKLFGWRTPLHLHQKYCTWILVNPINILVFRFPKKKKLLTIKSTFMVSSKKKKKNLCVSNFLKTLKIRFLLKKIFTFIFLGYLLNIICFSELIWYKSN